MPFQVLRSDLSTELIASRMHVCVFISESREFVVSGLGSEPVLADAVADVTRSYRLWNNLIAAYVDACASWAVDKGLSGEMVAALLFLMARDLCLPIRNCWANHPLLLGDWLTGLFGDNFSQIRTFVENALKKLNGEKEDTNNEEPSPKHRRTKNSRTLKESKKLQKYNDPLKVGKISFTHFVRVVGTPNNEKMLLYFSRGAAVLCKTGERAVDIVIPVLMPNEEDQYVISVDNLTYFSVQVKNWKNGGKPTVWPIHSTEFSSNHICINMLLQLGGKESAFECFEEKNPNYLSFASYGLTVNHFPFLKHEDLSRDNDGQITKEMLAALYPTSTYDIVYLLNLILGKEFDMTKLHRNPIDLEMAKTMCPGVYVEMMQSPKCQLDNI